MAKVSGPLFGNWKEAFGNTLVFQGSHNNLTIVRKKVKHAADPTSAHYKSRAFKWGKAITNYKNNNPLNESLIETVSRYALSPNAPVGLSVSSISANEEAPDKFDINITWEPVSYKYGGHPLSNLLGYIVSFSTDGIYWSVLNSVPITQNSWLDTREFGTYYYMVQAIDDQDNISSPSKVLEVETQVSPPFYNQTLYDRCFYTAENPVQNNGQYNSACYDTFNYS